MSARQVKFAEQFLQQPANVRDILGPSRDKLLVSYRHVDGRLIALSRYRDDEWVLNARTTNTNKAASKLRFETIPEPFRQTLKAVFYRYLRRGRDGVAPPASSTAVRTLAYMPFFLRHLMKLGITRLADATPLACSTYVQACKEHVPTKGKRKPLSQAALLQRFLSVEMLFELSHYTHDVMPVHPWPDSSAMRLAGFTGSGREARLRGKTPLMPDDVFCSLFQKAWEILETGADLLDLRDELDQIQLGRSSQHISTIARAKNARLEKYGITGGLEAYNDAIRDLRTACYVIAASVSGCRNHELAFVKSNAWSRVRDDDGNEIFWMHSTSTKTGAGQTRWMVPEAAIKALETMTRWAVPYQAQIAAEIASRRSNNPSDPQIAEALVHADAVFLGVSEQDGSLVRTLSMGAWNGRLKEFAQKCGLDWNLSSHQFRRKFANYAARSRFGDLRYLREHFKHWSMDMTLGYALNDDIEMELYLEIGAEYDGFKEAAVEHWLTHSTPLSGGYGRNLVAWRGDQPISLFKDHKQMVRSLAQSTAMRSNGHAWCTADDNLCVGNDIEQTRCIGCSNAVIGPDHKHVYQGLYDHLLEVLKCEDIGNSGRARVARDLDRCNLVLKDLGYDSTSVNAS